MGKLTEILTHALWREDPASRSALRLRVFITTPVMILAGTIWGILAAPGPEETLGWAAGGALAFSLVAYLHLRLRPAVAGLWEGAATPARWLASVLWDWLIISGAVYLLTDVVGMPTFPAVTSAVVIGGTYALGLASFFAEGGSRLLGGVLAGGWGRPRMSFSYVETLLARDDKEEARAALWEFVRLQPRDARGWLTLGRLLAGAGDGGGALRVLREGMARGSLTVAQERRYLEEIVRTCEVHDVPDAASPDLRRFLDAHAGSPWAAWAREQLSRMGEEA